MDSELRQVELALDLLEKRISVNAKQSVISVNAKTWHHLEIKVECREVSSNKADLTLATNLKH